MQNADINEDIMWHKESKTNITQKIPTCYPKQEKYAPQHRTIKQLTESRKFKTDTLAAK